MRLHGLSLWLLLGIYEAAMFAAYRFTLGFEAINRDADSCRVTFVHGFTWGIAITVLALAVLLAPNGETPPFIYFQF